MRQTRDTQNSLIAASWRRLASSRSLIPLIVVVIAVPVLLSVFVEVNGASSRMSVIGVILLVSMAVLAVVLLIGLATRLAGVDHDAPNIAGHLAVGAEQQRLLARWLTRARWARTVGGFSGVLAWILGTRAHGDLLLLGTGGIAIGAMFAELHQVRARKGPRTATLTVRSVDQYLMQSDRRRMVVVGVLGLAAMIAGVFMRHSHAAVGWGLAALLVLTVSRLVQGRVARRPRAALSAELVKADDLARELAIGRGLARPSTYCALVLVAHASGAMRPTLGTAAGFLQGAGWFYALYLWWLNRRLGLDFLLTDDDVRPVLA